MKKGASGKSAGAPTPASAPVVASVDESALLADLRNLIQSARQRIASTACATQTLPCWHLARRLLNENLQGARAEYGKQILVTVSRELAAEYGRGFSYAEIARMVQFAQQFPDEHWDVRTLRQKVGGMLFERTALSKKPNAIVATGIGCEPSFRGHFHKTRTQLKPVDIRAAIRIIGRDTSGPLGQIIGRRTP